MNVVDHLQQAMTDNNVNALNDALASIFRDESSLDSRIIPLLCELLHQTWHQQHEDLALVLQHQRDPRAIIPLASAATIKFDYLNYNDSHAFARKCVWALADIGTEEAKMQLTQLAQTADAEIAAYAIRRLQRWDTEQHRKGSNDEI